MTCETCKHWRADDEGGQCLRFPPQVATSDEDGLLIAIFPSTPPDWYCGEYARRVN